ncbi:MAG: hypothetical protein C5B49_01615 [Bdellovibrio sp.]|nr:MAG: hypothetical protein C5B49_01615 [Bdellovibrio sp.]
MIERILKEQIGRIRQSILLLGPRQTGKTTLLKALAPDLTVNLADERQYQDFLTDPGRLFDQIERQNPRTVFVDEIQRFPSLLNSIQVLIDEKKLRFLITGSSARKLKRGGANLLPGRIINKEIFPLTARELNYQIDTPKILKWGFLPGILTEDDEDIKRSILESYSANYLKEEIQQEALTRNLQGFTRFLSALLEYVGLPVDYSKISQKYKLNRFAVHRFFEIIEETMVGHRIFSYSGFAGADVVKHPKFYFFDNGVMNGLARDFDVSGSLRGVITETIIYNQLRAALRYREIPAEISFFRTRGGAEVDFVISGKKDMWAIEVKSNDHLSSTDVKGLRNFQQHAGKRCECLLFHFGKKEVKIDGIWCQPWAKGFKDLGW